MSADRPDATGLREAVEALTDKAMTRPGYVTALALRAVLAAHPEPEADPTAGERRPCDEDFGYPGNQRHAPHDWDASVQDRQGAPWREQTFTCPGVRAPAEPDAGDGSSEPTAEGLAEAERRVVVGPEDDPIRGAVMAGHTYAEAEALDWVQSRLGNPLASPRSLAVEQLAAALMDAVELPGPFRISANHMAVLTADEARTAARLVLASDEFAALVAALLAADRAATAERALRDYEAHVMAEVGTWDENVYPNRWDAAREKARHVRDYRAARIVRESR